MWVIESRSGELAGRTISVDTDRLTVLDNQMSWRNGAKSRMAAGETEFVQIADGKISWGNRVDRTGHPAGVFSLNLKTGFYSMMDLNNEQLGHGECRTAAATS